MQILNYDNDKNKIFKLKKNNINYYNYNDISEEIRLYKIFEMKTEYIKKDNKLLKINSFDNYTKNYIYNVIEQKNKESYYFLNKLNDIFFFSFLNKIKYTVFTFYYILKLIQKIIIFLILLFNKIINIIFSIIIK